MLKNRKLRNFLQGLFMTISSIILVLVELLGIFFPFYVSITEDNWLYLLLYAVWWIPVILVTILVLFLFKILFSVVE